MPRGYRRQVEELAAVLDLSDILGQRARALSGGLRRRLEIVRALMHRPGCCSSTSRPRAWTRRAGAACGPTCGRPGPSFGTTVFLTTHYLEEAEAADAVCVLAAGRIIERGSPAEVKARQLEPDAGGRLPAGCSSRPWADGHEPAGHPRPA